MRQIHTVTTLAVFSVLLSIGTAVATRTDSVFKSNNGSSFTSNSVTSNSVTSKSVDSESVDSKRENPLTVRKQATSELYSLTAKQGRLSSADNIYYLTMTLPDRPGKQFTQLSFSEQGSSNGVNSLLLDLASTKAFVGTREAGGGTIALERTWIDETGTIWVDFKQPVSSKTTLTIAFKAQRQPTRASYQYAIAAYPNSNRPVPIFVGTGMLRSQ